MRADYIDHMGDDLRVANAARVSFDKESDWETVTTYPEVSKGDEHLAGWGAKTVTGLAERDQKLIHFLARNGHWTPFSHPQVTLRETVPIFVARQRFKHMIGFTYNEVSRRYVDDTPEFHTPDVWRARAENKKQGSSDERVDYLESPRGSGDSPWPIDELYSAFLQHALDLYEDMLAGGVAPEQARMVLPQSMYTSYYVTGSLAAFGRAYKLRADPHAQKEIQDLAAQWDSIIRPLYPVSWSALVDV